MDVHRRLRTDAAAEYLGLAESSLEKDRVTRTLGVPFIKAGKIVVYDTRDLDAWLDARRRISTSAARPLSPVGATQPGRAARKRSRTPTSA
jgi:hypothetical protein